MTRRVNLTAADTARDFLFGLHRGVHPIVPWNKLDPEGLRGATGCTLVFLERNGLCRKLVDGECPEQSRDGKEQDPLGNIDTRANPTAT